jgi:hypothetical protein
MLSFSRESLLVAPVERHLRRQRFNAVYFEAPFGEYNIDVFGHSTSTGKAVAVELKLTKWQRAFEQALVYQLCADFAFVAMPRELIGRLPLAQFEEQGVGVIAVDGRGCHVIVQAVQSPVIRPDYREQVLRRVREAA